MRRFLFALTAFFIAPVSTRAQATESAFVDCKMADGTRLIYRINSDNWSTWDSERWIWSDVNVPRECKPGWQATDRNTCEVLITNQEYSLIKSSYWDTGDNFAIAQWSIIRSTGKFTFKLSNKNKFTTSNGVCLKATDPSQKPKPAPAM